MAGASSDGEINYWPAFVDVLTTVIMVVSFLLVIMSAAVMTLSRSVVTKLVSEQVAATNAKNQGLSGETGAAIPSAQSTGSVASPSPDSALRAEERQLGGPAVIALARSIVEAPALTAAPSDQTAETTGGQIIQSSTALVSINFDPSVTKFDQEIESKAIDIIRSRIDVRTAKLEIWSVAPSFGSVSAAERQAYYRAINARAVLTKAGVPGASISARVKVSDKSDSPHQVLILVKP